MFVYIIATAGAGEVNPYFDSDRNGSWNAGIITGAFHYAVPDSSSGDAQADIFANYGGQWSPDGKTLPGALLIDFNPFGSLCYGFTSDGMVNWIRSFSDRYLMKTGRYPVIHISLVFWGGCTKNSPAFMKHNRLWLAG